MRSHDNPAELLKFVERCAEYGYTLETITMIREEYPGSLPSMEPVLRQLAQKQLQAWRKVHNINTYKIKR